MITVYIDVLFTVNFLINILIIEGTGVIINEETKWKRSLASAFVGAIYAVAVFFPSMHFAQSLVMKIILSALMVVIAFKIKSRRHFFRMWGCFFLVSFIFGGAIAAIMSMTDLGYRMGAVYSNGTVYFNLPWRILFLSVGLTYFMITLFARIRKRKMVRESITRNLSIYINGTQIETKAIIDTGNSLFDPITGDPVIVCEYSQVESIIPPGDSLIDKMKDAGLRVRLIPFSSVGKEKGLMPAFLPDMVKIDALEAKRCIVGISENPLSQSDEYHALLNPMILVNKTER